MNPLELAGRTVVVTGASSGIGRATCLLLSQLAATVVLVGRNETRLRETDASLAHGPHVIEPYDLSDTAGISGWLKSLATKTGRLSGLVHCAGVHGVQPLRYLEADDLQRMMQVNFFAAAHLAKGFRQKSVCADPSSIVFVSSVMGLVGQAGLAGYAASKGAVVALTRALALELAKEGIRVNCVAPGQVRGELTDRHRQTLTAEQFAALEAQHPLGLGQPSDVAHAIAFLLADTGRWITGSTLVVDGGYTAH